MRDEDRPDIEGIVANLHRELVEEANREREAGFRGRLPTLDQDACDAADTYLEGHGAPNVSHQATPAAAIEAVRGRYFDAKYADRTMLLANTLGALATYARVRPEVEAWGRVHALGETISPLLREFIDALWSALDSSRRPSPDVLGWIAAWVSASRRFAEAAELRAGVDDLLERLPMATCGKEYLCQTPAHRDWEQVRFARYRLMPCYTNREIAEMIDDGQGGDTTARRERVKQQRRAITGSGAEMGSAAIPLEQGGWLMVSCGSK